MPEADYKFSRFNIFPNLNLQSLYSHQMQQISEYINVRTWNNKYTLNHSINFIYN